jgi:putative photosynthetic complex assembly protein
VDEPEFGSEPFPKAPLFGAGALIALALLSVVLVRTTGVGATRVPDSAPITARDFRFEDRTDGGIAVYDARDGRLVEVVAPGTNGFLRGTLRGLARERKRQGVGPLEPFRLTGKADGRLTLDDPTTGRRVDLEAFGPTNAGVFAELLTAKGATP